MQCKDTKLMLSKIISSGTKLTPMMQQYYDIKKDYPDTLLMFRMGDFYELFFEDAIESAKILNISLTHRGKLGEHKIPMAGIPHHAASNYIDRITSLGKKVAICEQVEDPKLAKGIVKRAVTQVVSPGMPYDLDRSEQKENAYISCAYKHEDHFYLILLDFTTGEFLGMTLPDETTLVEKLNLYQPKEFICYLGQWDQYSLINSYSQKENVLKTNLSKEYFLEKYTSTYIEKIIPSYQRDEVLKLYPFINVPIGAISFYIISTQSLDSLNHIRLFQLIAFDEDMKVTYPTLVGLEILPKSIDRYQDSLLGFMDETQTALGARKLKKMFLSPLRSIKLIENRLKVIEELSNDTCLLEKIRNELSHIRDLERIMAKTSTGKVNASDLICLKQAIVKFQEIQKISKKIFNNVIPLFSKSELNSLITISSKIERTINDEIGASLEKGNLIKKGANASRDKLKELTTNITDKLIELETKYRKETNINNLKVKHNNVAGYFIEVSKSHTSKVPKYFERRQTLVNSERYQTTELVQFESEVILAKEKLYKLEKSIFDDITNDLKTNSLIILELAKTIAMIDCMQSMSQVVLEHDFTKPELQNNDKELFIKEAWHPLIKKNILDQFVNHNIKLDQENYFGLITGPNMAGKTTVMREMAIIQLLSQIGSFVPAKQAKLGLCDFIFSRLGASDDIIKGQSTFMVEMSETAEIIRHATERSLIILDEIGRGTSTFDGLSIAWALVEHFVKNTKAITLFSTHYHELIDLVDSLSGAKNFTVETINENGKVQFLYQLVEKGAAQSFGIHVAKLAGLPSHILKRSSQVLQKLEKGSQKNNTKVLLEENQIDLFDFRPEELTSNKKSLIEEELLGMDLENMTPIQVMHKVFELKSQSL